MSINRVLMSGNLTRDPEMRATPGGTQVLSMGVAVNDRRRNQQTGEWEDYPNFIDCVMFGNRAESVARYLSKGTKVTIEGKLRWSQWQAKDGSKRSKVEVVVDDIELPPSGQQGQGQTYRPQQATYQPQQGQYRPQQATYQPQGAYAPQGGYQQAYQPAQQPQQPRQPQLPMQQAYQAPQQGYQPQQGQQQAAPYQPQGYQRGAAQQLQQAPQQPSDAPARAARQGAAQPPQQPAQQAPQQGAQQPQQGATSAVYDEDIPF